MNHEIVSSLENYYTNSPFGPDCIVSDCKIGKCNIIGADKTNFLIIDGDKIKDYRKESGKSSCDRIVLKKNYQDEIILFAEMSDTKKGLKKVTRQLEDSYEEISKVYEEKSMKQAKKPKFLYLGRLKSAFALNEIKKKKISTAQGPIKIKWNFPIENISSFF